MTHAPSLAGPAATPESFSLKPMVLAIGMAFGLAAAGTAHAATFTVNNLANAGAGSLRQAVLDANAAAGADTIVFAPGLTGTITLTTGQLNVTDSVTIQGPGAASLTVSGNNASRVLYLYNNAALLDVTISGLTIANGNATIGAGIANFDENLTLDGVVLSNNHATSDGGGLWADGFTFSMTVRNSTITGNTAGGNGGGVYVEDTGGLLLFQNTTISNNQATGNGGGVYFYDPDHAVTFESSTISGNTAGGKGGGIFLYDTDGGPFTIRNTTVSGNTAQQGGGVYLHGPDDPVVIVNSTISGNTATAGPGGGIQLYNTGAGITIDNSTVAGNTASTQGGGIFFDSGTLTLRSTIVGVNTASSAANGNDIFRASGTVDASNSLIQSAPAGTVNGTNTANITGANPQLGPLQNNGGPTLTRALLAGSPAIDAGSNPNALATDQRGTGFARTAGTATDIGALEVQSPVVTISGTPVVAEGGSATFTLTLSQASSAPITVTVTPTGSGGSPATAGSDFAAAPVSVTIPAGNTTAPVSIPTLADTVSPEAGETFAATITSAPGATIGTAASATGTITDVPPVVTIGGAPSVSEGSAAVFTLTLSFASGAPVNVTVTPAGSGASPATAGTDFAAAPVVVTIPAGNTSATVSVPTSTDAVAEPSETFTATITSASGATIGAGASAVATINDVTVAGPAPQRIPTLSQWALALLTMLLGMAAHLVGRPRRPD